MPAFKDNFSKQSDIYLRYRPTYPSELFEYLAAITPGHDLAWDCGTGNGQAAIHLARYYKSVYATDPSEEQIRNAVAHAQIVYEVEKAEHSSLDDASADLITVAQALHWFDFDTFYPEAKRVLKSNGIIAAWAYGIPRISKEIDHIIQHFHDEVVGEFWQYENRLIEKEYSTIPFPFKELMPPIFNIQKNGSLSELLGLINTWSAVQRFIGKNGINPVGKLEEDLIKHWGKPENKKTMTWKLILKIGQKNS